MKLSIVLSLLGQSFAFATEPEESETEEAETYTSVAAETERAPIGFAVPEYDEEARRA